MVVDEEFHPFHILTPIIIGVGDIFESVFRADRFVEVREIIRMGHEGNRDDPEREPETDDGIDAVSQLFFRREMLFIMQSSLDELRQGFRDEEIEEKNDREEVAEADVEISGNRDNRIKRYESSHGPFGSLRVETLENRFKSEGRPLSP